MDNKIGAYEAKTKLPELLRRVLLPRRDGVRRSEP